MKRTHRDLWPFNSVEFSVVMRLAHSCTLHFYLIFKIIWVNDVVHSADLTPIFNVQTKITKLRRQSLFFGSCSQMEWATVRTQHEARTTPKPEFLFFHSLMICCVCMATTLKIISTMRNFTLQIKIIISMDAIHMCGFLLV